MTSPPGWEHSSPYPVRTQHCFSVYATSITLWQRRMSDVKMTLCAAQNLWYPYSACINKRHRKKCTIYYVFILLTNHIEVIFLEFLRNFFRNYRKIISIESSWPVGFEIEIRNNRSRIEKFKLPHPRLQGATIFTGVFRSGYQRVGKTTM